MGVSKNSKAHRRYFGFVPECYKSNYYDVYAKDQYTSYNRQADGNSTSNPFFAGGSVVGFLPFDVVPKQIQNT